MLNKLTKEQIEQKIKFIENYMGAFNTADASLVDANSNVEGKNIGILESELYKYETIQVNRALVMRKMDEKTQKSFLKDLDDHLIYIHDETSLRPYCASVTMFPFLFEGTKTLGGTSKAPKNLQSFCGSFVNLVYQLASGFAGAIATVEFLMYFDYFAKKSYGEEYLTTHAKTIEQELQGVLYALNQPASARGNQSVFWNISVFDKYYFDGIFSTFIFPDGTKPDYNSLAKLQEFFMEFFRKEREKELLTYPVLTAAILVDESGEPKDEAFADMLAEEMSKGLSFFVYESDSADSLASCCRLRNELADNTFSYTLGAGGVSTGSIQVITVNMSQFLQRYGYDMEELERVIERVHKYLIAFRDVYVDYLNAGLLPAYSAGFIDMKKQFLTIGINGMLEGMECLGYTARDEEYRTKVSAILELINKLNKAKKLETHYQFNTEFVPAENLGVKNSKWDKEMGLKAKRECYNSYFFPVEDDTFTLVDKLKLHGKDMVQHLDGGSACHLNLARIPTKSQALQLIRLAGQLGCNYWTFNCLMTICDACGYINVDTKDHCVKCGETDNIDYATRVIGYLRRVSNYSQGRRKEHGLRYYQK